MTNNQFVFLKITPLLLLVGLFFWSCEKETNPPVIESISPTFGPAETLVTFEGVNLGDLKELRFGDQVINFNTAYNSQNALLLRIPTNLTVGEYEVSYTTNGGTATTNFRVTLEPPEIFSFSPASASVGERVTVLGKNFFEPMQVWFFDSMEAEIVHLAPDSLIAIVPPGVEKGRIAMMANGGFTLSPINFFTVNPILVNDFDGNGLRADTENWIFRGSLDQNKNTAIQNRIPEPIDGNYLKISGRDELNINWIGGVENHTWDTDQFQTFGITTDANNTFIEMEMNNNGRKNTTVIIILIENEGSNNDFTVEVDVDWDGWNKFSVPLNRFTDFNDFVVDPIKVKTVKIQLIDTKGTGDKMEINVDNLRFLEIL